MEDHLPHYQIRPRFRASLDLTMDQIRKKLSNAISSKKEAVGGQVITGHATITLPEQDQHYWSPQLTLSFEEEGNGVLLRGMYSPRPAIWTMFVLCYSVIGFATLIVSIIGYSNWTLGQSAAILWAVPVLIAVFLSIYLVSYTGQKVGRKQMIILHKFVEQTLGIEILDD